MYATEFQTIINEPYIKIPKFELFKGHKVRVVLLDMEERGQANDYKEDFIDYLIRNPIEMPKNSKFLSREEANER